MTLLNSFRSAIPKTVKSWVTRQPRTAGLVVLLFFILVVNGVMFFRGSLPDQDNLILSKEFDFGVRFVSPDEHLTLTYEHPFEVTNPTDEPWNLRFTGASCGCTKPTVDHVSLAPGQSSIIPVRVEASGKVQEFVEQVDFVTGAQHVGKVTLRVRATVYPRLAITGIFDRPIDVPTGEAREVRADIYGRQPYDEPTASVQLVEHSQAEGFDVTLGEPAESDAADGYRVLRCPLILKLKATADPGALSLNSLQSGTVQVAFGGATLTQRVSWRPLRPVTASPSRMFLRQNHKTPVTRHLTLRSSQPFRVTEVSADSPVIVCSCEDSNELTTIHRVAVTATCPTPEIQPSANAVSVHITTDHPEQQTLFVAVSVMPPPNEHRLVEAGDNSE